MTSERHAVLQFTLSLRGDRPFHGVVASNLNEVGARGAWPTEAPRTFSAEIAAGSEAAVGGIRANMERARDLVRDAVARLLASFGALRSIVERQQHALQDIAQTLTNEGAGNLTETASKLVNEFVEEVVRVSHNSMRIIEQLGGTAEHVDAIIIHAERLDSLARETRFVALNARIETQRAGEAGRTFKVVADEVRRLASLSAALSHQIREEVAKGHERLRDSQVTAESLASRDMSSSLGSRSVLVSAIEHVETINRTVEETLKQLGESVGEAVRALQFEDMVAQLVNDSVRRVQRFGALMVEALEETERGDPDPRRMAEIAEELRQLARMSNVQQSSMATGTVELF